VPVPSSGTIRGLIARHWARFGSFSVIGGLIFLLKLALQALLVQAWHVGRVISYVVPGIVAIQANFLLNRRFTWHDRRVSLWVACYRFNVQKLVTASLNTLLYTGLIRLGINYLIANILTTGVFTAINYTAAHRWAFATRTPGQPARQPSQSPGSGASHSEPGNQ
ncbi:MAG: GtrA family protein, partial [Actinobacteria bacterium]|nr:GtrA family protein [Actinomycetota bacterium]